MSSREMEIKNLKTLAPLRENIYQFQYVSQKDATILTSISKNLLQNINLTIGSLSQMINHLNIYKNIVIDSINAEAESIDIATKYHSNPPRQYHTLPGVTSLPMSYDLQSIKKDNERSIAISEIRDKVSSQRELYMKVLRQEYKALSTTFKKLLYCESTLDSFISSIDQNINN